jgi:hypothetical protein
VYKSNSDFAVAQTCCPLAEPFMSQINSSLPVTNTEVTVFMRSQDHPDSSGWIARLKDYSPACVVTSRSERFGRISYVIKKDGVGVTLQQGVSSENKTVFADLSWEQSQIIGLLVEIGIVGKVLN